MDLANENVKTMHKGEGENSLWDCHLRLLPGGCRPKSETDDRFRVIIADEGIWSTRRVAFCAIGCQSVWSATEDQRTAGRRRIPQIFDVVEKMRIVLANL